MASEPTVPADSYDQHKPARLIVEASYVAPDGSVYVHKDLVKAVEPWAVEQHIEPVLAHERFGDVESWAEYVKNYAPLDDESHDVFLTWNESGLHAVLDYHLNIDQPGRCQWTADHHFIHSTQWKSWAALANGQPRTQKQLVESLEDLAEDIVEPDQAELLTILRSLRASSSAKAETTLDPDGSTRVSFSRDSMVQGVMAIPAMIVIAIPVLKGDPTLYKLPVRLRVAVDDDAHLTFRLSMPTAERARELVYADRVEAAKAALGDGYTLLRAG